MKQVKLYNVIFPIWFLLFFPPVILITLLGNYVIDSLVIIVCFKVFKLVELNIGLKTFYIKSIFKAWMFGFIADIIGASLLFIVGMLGDGLGISNQLISGINYDPFSHPLAVGIIVFAMLVSALLILLFNYKFTFTRLIEDKKLRFKVALTMAVVTIPWTFLLPTKWFYHGI